MEGGPGTCVLDLYIVCELIEMFAYQQPVQLGGESQGKVFCTTPGCIGWVWNTRTRVSHCRLCSEPIDWSGVVKPSDAKGTKKGYGKSSIFSGKGGLSRTSHAQGGGMSYDGWPPLGKGPAVQFPYGMYYVPPQKGAWSKARTKGDKSSQLPAADGGKGKGSGAATAQPTQSGESKEDAARRQAERQVALAQQEVQFYRRMEQKSMLPLQSRQMQEAQERLRKAKLHELGSRSLPQQAKSLRDKLHGLEVRLSQQRVEAAKLTDHMATLQEQHRVLAESHVELKREKAEVRARLDLVEAASSKEIPEQSWTTKGRTDPMDSVFMDFQSHLQQLFPDLGKSQADSLNAALGTVYKTASHIQSAKLDSRESTAKRVRTGGDGGQVGLSGPSYFRIGEAEDDPGQDEMQCSGDSQCAAQRVVRKYMYGDSQATQDQADRDQAETQHPPKGDQEDQDSGPIDGAASESFYEGDTATWRRQRQLDSLDDAGSSDLDDGDAERNDFDGGGDDMSEADSRVSECTRVAGPQRRGTLDPAREAARRQLPNADVFRKSWEPPSGRKRVGDSGSRSPRRPDGGQPSREGGAASSSRK